MRIAFESNLLMPSVSKAISMLTDRARVCIKDVHYDKAKGIVEIYMQRKDLIGFKRSFLGEAQPVYGQNMIKSVLKIQQVEEMELRVDERLATDCDSCFTVLFGLKMNDKHLYLGSAEEIRGNTLCQIFIKVTKLSIEYRDEKESGFRDREDFSYLSM